MYDSKEWVREAFDLKNKDFNYCITYFPDRLSLETAYMAANYSVVCCFVNDDLNAEIIRVLSRLGIKLIALRCAGYDRVNLEMAATLGIPVVRVPAYSPYAVAEHAVALMLTLNRKIHRSFNRTREGNFSLDSLIGFDMHGKTIGVIGTGKIGQILVNILLGFGCNILCYDLYPNKELSGTKNVKYVELDELYAASDAISIHAPLTDKTKHMINHDAVSKMKKGVIVVNTSRGALVDTKALVDGLTSGQIGSAGLDVYEQESKYFFEDRSSEIIQDPLLARLQSLGNVIITGHQAFLTREAINNIAETTLKNIKLFQEGKKDNPNVVKAEY